MSSLRLSTGHEVPLDGDLLAVLEGLYREVTLKRQFKGSFEDMMREIEGLVDQMSAADRRRYLVESLFLNYNTFESEMLDAYARRLTAEEEGAAGGGRCPVRRAVPRPRRPSPRGGRRRGGGGHRGRRPASRVEPESFDFGKALPGKTLGKEFTIRNFGDAELVIDGVSTTCGCTAALAADSQVEARRHDRAARDARDPHLLGEGGAPGARPVERPEAPSSSRSG